MATKTDSLTVSFSLDAQDIDYFRDRLERARSKGVDEAGVIAAAEGLSTSVAAAEAPSFVRASFGKLGSLIGMLKDKDWRLEGEDRARVLSALAYFADPEDIIPDRIPGLGFLDDAIMIELVAGELAPELEAYGEFLAFQEGRAQADAGSLAEQRDEIQGRMRRRTRRMRTAASSGQRLSVFGVQ
jgi:hypothetical protein